MKIIHISDLHLGYRAYNKLSPEGLNVREKDVIKAFKESLDKISLLKPDLVIMAGDVFHKPRPSNSTIYLTIKLLHDFRKTCNAPIVIISGNHEASKSLESGSILKILETTTERVIVVDGAIKQVTFDGLEISVLCVPHNALSELNKTCFVPDNNYKYNVLTMHCSYDSIKCPELSKYTNEELVDADKINAASWNYVALGHYHKFTELEKNTYYSGAIERTSSNIWQESKDPKGFIEYNLDSGEMAFHALETPRKVFEINRIDAKSLTAEEIDARISKEIAEIDDFENSIVRITLENIDNIASKNLDYSKIREYRKKAVHFMLNFVKKEHKNSFEIEEAFGEDFREQGRNLNQIFEEELLNFVQNELSQGVKGQNFSDTARKYFAALQEQR